MPIDSQSRGFSLIETVMFIVIVGIAVAAISTQFSQSVLHSAEPILRQQAVTIANGYIDEIIRKRWDELTPIGGRCVPTTGPSSCTPAWLSTTYELGDWVIPTAYNSHIYEAIAVAGNKWSDAVEPAWPTDGTSVVDNNVTWIDLGKISLIAADYGADGEARSGFDDIDDYHGLSNSPPEDASGTSLTDFNNFTVDVTVSSEAWNGIPANDVKRVVVDVTNPLNETLSFTFYRINF